MASAQLHEPPVGRLSWCGEHLYCASLRKWSVSSSSKSVEKDGARCHHEGGGWLIGIACPLATWADHRASLGVCGQMNFRP